jgi:crotonobetainyl-CoA:carnitine CoA-transferase CaiB-like acyl-CoA transferase
VAAEQVVRFTASGTAPSRLGNWSSTCAPQNVYRVSGEDEWIAISVETDGQWQALARALDHPPWASDPALAKRPDRLSRREELDERLQGALGHHTVGIVEHLCRAGVPAAAVALPRTVHRNEQLVARNFFERVSHPVVGEIRVPGFPGQWTGRARWHRSAAPTLGQHNDEVLASLVGLSGDEIAGLRRSGVIGERPS